MPEPAITFRRHTTFSPALCMAFALFSVSACDDPETQASSSAPTREEVASPASSAWLDRTDDSDPAAWLAGRSRNGADAMRYRALLDRASDRYLESARMIANRVAQLEQMLAEHGITEGADQLLDDLTAVAAVRNGRTGFGEVCQHYYNLRTQGTDRPAAMAAIGASGIPPQ